MCFSLIDRAASGEPDRGWAAPRNRNRLRQPVFFLRLPPPPGAVRRGGHDPALSPAQQPARLRGGGAACELHQGGDRAMRDAGRARPPGEGARGPARRAALPPAAARPGADRRGAGAAAGAARGVRPDGGRARPFRRRPGREVLAVGAVGSFALGWLLPRLAGSRRPIPRSTCGSAPTTTASTSPRRGWISRSASATAPGTAPRRRCCSGAADVAVRAETAARLREPADWRARSCCAPIATSEWPAWFEAAGVPTPPLTGPVFDSAPP